LSRRCRAVWRGEGRAADGRRQTADEPGSRPGEGPGEVHIGSRRSEAAKLLVRAAPFAFGGGALLKFRPTRLILGMVQLSARHECAALTQCQTDQRIGRDLFSFSAQLRRKKGMD
jgi:hypothetical protein